MKSKNSKEISKAEHLHIFEPYQNGNVILHFAGTLKCNRYFELSPHTNPGYEICLISGGKGFFKIDNEVFIVGDKQLFITQPLQCHSGWSSPEDPYMILYICFSIKQRKYRDSIIEDIEKELLQIKYPVSKDSFVMCEVHNQLMEEITKSKPYSGILIDSLVMQFIALTLRNFKSYADTGDGIKAISNSNTLSAQIIKFIDEYAEDRMNLDMVAEKLNYSVQHLCRKFKEQTGLTIMEYYNLSRLECAKKYLSESDSSITQIAEKLHFNSIHHFSSAFKSTFNASPNEYRKARKRINIYK